MRPTKAVRKYLMGRFTIKSCLREGIINYSALSRKIVEAESVEGDVPATAMALRRETARITRPGNDARVFRLFKNATFSVRNRMAVLLKRISHRMRKMEVPSPGYSTARYYWNG